MTENRSDTGVRDTLAVALVVAMLGVVATLPRAGPEVPVFASVPPDPCDGVEPRHRDACLRVAHALLER